MVARHPGGLATSWLRSCWNVTVLPGDVVRRRSGCWVSVSWEHAYGAVDLDRHDPAEVGEWLARHRAEVVAAIRACDRDGSRRDGTRLACAVWPAARLVPDPTWWEALAEA